jgi:hypothetical protein
MNFLSSLRTKDGNRKSVSGSLTLVSRAVAYNGETVDAASSTVCWLRIPITRIWKNFQHAAFEPIAGGICSGVRALAGFAR